MVRNGSGLNKLMTMFLYSRSTVNYCLLMATRHRLSWRWVLGIVMVLSCGVQGQSLKAYQQKIDGTPVSFSMVPIGAGKFRMGSAASEVERDVDEGPLKEIEIAAFWMEAHEVTFAEWDAFFKDNTLPQSKTIDGITRPTPQYIDLTWGMGRDLKQPTNSMSQQAAMMYCKWLYYKTGFFYRLPTEAEWEYACRAGSTTKYPFGDNVGALKEYAYYQENSEAKFHAVATKKPNAWGLYDMLGNLSEWTLDQYEVDYYQKGSNKNPLNPPVARYRKAVRGGSYFDAPNELRCANRIPSEAKWNQRDPQIPKSRWWLTDAPYVGFRVVRPLAQPTEQEIENFYAGYLK
jgi:formylglycine-generating enzyme required for sulfatase activity